MPMSGDLPVRIRPEVASLPVYVPGKPASAAAGTTTYKLSSNENPYPAPPAVLAAVQDACREMNRYPDLGNVAITGAVGERLGVETGRIAFATGSVGVLYHLLQAVCDPGDEVVYAWRSFEAFPIATQVTGAHAVQVPLGPGAVHDLSAMRAAVGPATRVVLLCSPNNPTGPALRHADVLAFVDSVPDHVLIVLDEAYHEFVRIPDALRGLEIERPNVAVLRTFSKAYGLAGFRVGYCVAHPALAAAVRTVALPFGVSVAAQAAVLASLAAEAELFARVETIVADRDALAEGLRRVGWDIPDAQGNFVWLPSGAAAMEHAARFADAGLVVRPFAGDGIRITVGVPDANARVVDVAATLLP
jgi:histidinol-phosphate aminotransferase